MTYVIIASGAAALLFAAFLARSVLKEDMGTSKMKEISEAIQLGWSAPRKLHQFQS